MAIFTKGPMQDELCADKYIYSQKRFGDFNTSCLIWWVMMVCSINVLASQQAVYCMAMKILKYGNMSFWLRLATKNKQMKDHAYIFVSARKNHALACL